MSRVNNRPDDRHSTCAAQMVYAVYSYTDGDFNGHIPVSVFQAKRLHALLYDKFWCFLTARYHKCLYRLDIQNSDLDGTPLREQITVAMVQPDGSVAINVPSNPNLPLDATVTDSSI